MKTPIHRIMLPSGLAVTAPGHDTVIGFTLAKLIKGEAVNQLVFNQWDMTRLSGYIQELEQRGLQGYIKTRPLPLTMRQKRGRGSKPFFAYYLSPEAIASIDRHGGSAWAHYVLNWHAQDRKEG